ncbi:MAG TPA: flagellar assembly protein FliW [Polyangiaceae bacterium]
MAQLPSGIDVDSAPEIMPLVPLGGRAKELSHAVFAVNDAGNLAGALGANLDWIARSVGSDPLDERSRAELLKAVQVCRHLTSLLGGAIGSCKTAARATTPRITPVLLSQIVCGAVSKVSRLADSMGILLVGEGPSELRVLVDSDLLVTALATLLIRAIHTSTPQSTVRITSNTCGGHAVVGVSADGAWLPPAQLDELYADPAMVRSEGSLAGLNREALRAISTILLEQGGYVDAENRPDGGTTIFVVVPAYDEAISPPVESGTVFAAENGSSGRQEPAAEQKRSDKMIVNSDRFGAIEVDATDVLSFPTGIIGFPKEDAFVLVRKTDSQVVGWLQSTHSSYLTLPVVSAHVLSPRFPDVPIEDYAERAGLGCDIDELAVLAVLSAPPGQPATVNLMAPIIVNAATRTGAQILIEGTRFTTRELFIIAPTSTLDLEHTATSMPNEAQPAISAAE